MTPISHHRTRDRVSFLTFLSIILPIFGIGWSIIPPASAIPEAKAIDKIQNIPVYIITDPQGAPLEASNKQNPDKPIAGVFARRQDAQNFIDKTLKSQQPNLPTTLKVTQASLGDIYQRQRAAKGNRGKGLEFMYVPSDSQRAAAISLLQQQGQKIKDFAGMPVFMATKTSAQGKESYVTVKRKGKEVIPIFFSQENLQMTLSRLYPGQSSKYKIRVEELNHLIDYMISSNDRSIELFEFNPMPQN
jgi:hypothetical protein